MPSGQLDGAGDNLPVRLGQAAVGHGAVDDLVVALASLQQHPAGKRERVGRGIDRRAAHGAHALRAMHIEKRAVCIFSRMSPRVGVDEHIVGSAGELQVAFRLQLRGGLVIDDFVGAQNVVAIVDHDLAGEGPGVAHAALALGLPLHRHAACGRRLRLGHGQNLLAGVVRQGGCNFRRRSCARGVCLRWREVPHWSTPAPEFAGDRGPAA